MGTNAELAEARKLLAFCGSFFSSLGACCSFVRGHHDYTFWPPLPANLWHASPPDGLKHTTILSPFPFIKLTAYAVPYLKEPDHKNAPLPNVITLYEHFLSLHFIVNQSSLNN